MIDYMFYHNMGKENIRRMYDGSLNRDDLFAMVQANRSDLPSIDQLETTNACNLKCVMCPRGKANRMTRPVQSMDQGLFRNVIDQIAKVENAKSARGIGMRDFKENPPPSLVWPGSEYDVCALRLHHFGSPMLDPAILERVNYIKTSTQLPIQFSETIINLKLQQVRELFRMGLDRLIIALDGTNAEEFEASRGVRVANFDAMIQRVRDIIEAKLQLGDRTKLDVQIIQMKHTPRESFIREWESAEGVDVHVKPFFPYPDIPHELVTDSDTVFQRDCRLPFTSLTIMADGRVVPCNSDYNGEHVFGDLNHQSLQEVWNSPEVIEFCRRFIFDLFQSDSLCNRCGFYPHYKGGDQST
ncbi:MAG: radical SAM/SPASM domain-containing protein [Candidatus Peribacteraceae bacterium]|nr:radical SAM/SPASM domain-containing protein [Candidatus Peribacteraceae bacterium]